MNITFSKKRLVTVLLLFGHNMMARVARTSNEVDAASAPLPTGIS